jgi:hypothetical protein
MIFGRDYDIHFLLPFVGKIAEPSYEEFANMDNYLWFRTENMIYLQTAVYRCMRMSTVPSICLPNKYFGSV